MNAYVVTEGESEFSVYPHWIPRVNPRLSRVLNVEDIHSDNYFIQSGHGFPFFYDVVRDAIADLALRPHISRLIIAADSEDLTREEKETEIQDFLSQFQVRADVRIILQHFCFEVWALGNQRAVPPNPRSQTLRGYMAFHNVRTQDPEDLPAHPSGELNRAQFAHNYIRLALNDRHPGNTYTKGRPRPLMTAAYYDRLMSRQQRTGHIASISTFSGAFAP